MNTEEHLNKIKEKCRELLAIAEKRTEGKWVYAPSRHTHDSPIHQENATAEHGYIGEDNGGVVGSSEWIWLKDEDATFIATCAGPAEAGWRATIAAIDWIITIRHAEGPKGTYEMLNNILAAWPEELI